MLEKHAIGMQSIELIRREPKPVNEYLAVVLTTKWRRPAHACHRSREAIRRLRDPAAASAPIVDLGDRTARCDRHLLVVDTAVVPYVAPCEIGLVQRRDQGGAI